MSKIEFRLKRWYRKRVQTEDVRSVAHARARLAEIQKKEKVTGATVLMCTTEGVNAGKWFLHTVLK